MTMYVILLISLSILEVSPIWPPPYEIKLTDSETFVISDISEDFLTDEDEMIQGNQMKPTLDNDKYFRIHQLALRRNKKEIDENRHHERNAIKIKEQNFDLEDPVPWEGGFVDKNGNFIQPENENVYYLNEMAKSLIESKIKRENEKMDEDKEVNYDYNSFKSEYKKEIEQAKTEKGTLNYTEVKEDESLEEAVETIVEVKESKNCTAEEMKGIGLSAMKCIVTDLKTAKSKNSILNLCEKILRISLIWFCVYAVIAIPCWCTRGWCCCCCCCKICRPREVIDEAKHFFVTNPPGVFHDKSGQIIEYEPTDYEIYTQQRLEKAIFKL